MVPKLPLSLLKLISIVLYTSNIFGEYVFIVHYIVYNKLSEPLGYGHKGEVHAYFSVFRSGLTLQHLMIQNHHKSMLMDYFCQPTIMF